MRNVPNVTPYVMKKRGVFKTMATRGRDVLGVDLGVVRAGRVAVDADALPILVPQPSPRRNAMDLSRNIVQRQIDRAATVRERSRCGSVVDRKG
jgi:hypothetical protein